MRNLIKFLPKFMAVCFICLLALGLVACEKGGGGGGTSKTDEFWDADGNGTPDWQEKEITLTYATWQYNDPNVETIDSMLVKEFMKKYPNIHVEMQIVGESSNWELSFLKLLEADGADLPDVFLVDRLENILPYGILADLTTYYDNDPDTEYIFDSVKNLGLYDGKRYVIPTFIYPEVWVVNKTLLRENNIAIPPYDWTWDQMEGIAKAVGNDPTHKTIGLYGSGDYLTASTEKVESDVDQYYFELPKILKLAADAEAGKKWLAYSYDGSHFNFADPVFLAAMAKYEEALDAQDDNGYGWMVGGILPAKAFDWYGSTVDPRYSGHVAIWREPAWQFKNHMNDITFDWDIYPGPSGVTGGNTDIAGVCQLCENKAAAYQLLKYLSFGRDGMVKRYELYAEYSEELFISANNYPFPIVDYGINKDGVNEIWDNIPYAVTKPGFAAPEFVESLRNGAIKANKEVVGWDEGENTFKTYVHQVVMDGAHYATLAEDAQIDANLAQQIKREAVADAIKNMSR